MLIFLSVILVIIIVLYFYTNQNTNIKLNTIVYNDKIFNIKPNKLFVVDSKDFPDGEYIDYNIPNHLYGFIINKKAGYKCRDRISHYEVGFIKGKGRYKLQKTSKCYDVGKIPVYIGAIEKRDINWNYYQANIELNKLSLTETFTDTDKIINFLNTYGLKKKQWMMKSRGDAKLMRPDMSNNIRDFGHLRSFNL